MSSEVPVEEVIEETIDSGETVTTLDEPVYETIVSINVIRSIYFIIFSLQFFLLP